MTEQGTMKIAGQRQSKTVSGKALGNINLSGFIQYLEQEHACTQTQISSRPLIGPHVRNLWSFSPNIYVEELKI